MGGSVIRKKRLAEHIWLVSLPGEHDLVDVALVDEAMAGAFAAGSCLIVDLTDTTLIDSTVMNAILAKTEEASASNGEHRLLVVAGAQTRVRRLLEIGLDGYIDVYEDVPAALDAIA